ncbi:MAG: hypothetical protein GY778_01160 [bacterium]|nr:hypothetical protein [bacterium]
MKSDAEPEPMECAVDADGRSHRLQTGSTPDYGVAADPALLAAGWVRRHMADPDRAAESVELYTAVGFEVKLQELAPSDFGAQCQACASTVCKSYVVVYTRKRETE